jgi:4'-phosphopantetheinyl transferase
MVKNNLVVAVRVVLARPKTELPRLAAYLSDAENARMARFRFPDDRRRYLVAHGVLREILAEYTGSGNPARLGFREGPHGKPILDPPGLKFNLSHSGELAMIAVSASREVGVDIERIRPDLDVLAIAHRYFAPEEARRLTALSAAQQTAEFFKLWTCKEAYAKARGMALAPALRQTIANDGEWGVESIDAGQHAGEGYAAAVAYGLDLCREKSNRRPKIILTMR